MICTFQQIVLGRLLVTFLSRERREMSTEFWSEKLDDRVRMKAKDVYRRFIIKWTLNQLNWRLWAGWR